MSVDKELLEYCANFARVTPRVTPLAKGMHVIPPYCAIYSPNGAEAWVSPVKRRQERRPGVRFGLYLLLR